MDVQGIIQTPMKQLKQFANNLVEEFQMKGIFLWTAYELETAIGSSDDLG